eukprot:gene35023-42413_t
MLEYDNSAFYYFALTLLFIYIVPGTYYAVAELFRAFLGSGGVGAKPRTKEEREKAKKLKQENTGWARLRTTKYIANLVCLIVAWSIFIYLMSLVANDGEVSSFDPYQILGIEQGATTSEIKKAYRRLSLKYHPDKNIGNKLAEEMFVKITKAHEALTDEAAKENYEKYGNPDGKQALEVSIGLPKILLDNPKVVLVLYLLFMVVAVPAAVEGAVTTRAFQGDAAGAVAEAQPAALEEQAHGLVGGVAAAHCGSLAGELFLGGAQHGDAGGGGEFTEGVEQRLAGDIELELRLALLAGGLAAMGLHGRGEGGEQGAGEQGPGQAVAVGHAVVLP